MAVNFTFAGYFYIMHSFIHSYWVKSANTHSLKWVQTPIHSNCWMSSTWRESHLKLSPSIIFRTDKSYHFQTIWFFLRNNTLPHPTHLRLHPSDWIDRHKWFISTCAAEIWATRRRFSTTYMLNIINVQRVNAEMNIIHCDITWRHSDSSAMNKWLFLHVQQKYQARGADFHSILKHIPHSSSYDFISGQTVKNVITINITQASLWIIWWHSRASRQWFAGHLKIWDPVYQKTQENTEILSYYGKHETLFSY